MSNTSNLGDSPPDLHMRLSFPLAWLQQRQSSQPHIKFFKQDLTPGTLPVRCTDHCTICPLINILLANFFFLLYLLVSYIFLYCSFSQPRPSQVLYSVPEILILSTLCSGVCVPMYIALYFHSLKLVPPPPLPQTPESISNDCCSWSKPKYYR